MSDNLTPAQRSYCMSRVKGRDTGLEELIRSALHRNGLRFKKHVPSLPGRPDIVFPRERIAIFLDGDFWHGYRFPVWAATVPAFWQAKIALNRARDQRNFRRLRRMGWTVIRIWQHAVRRDLGRAVEQINRAVRRGYRTGPVAGLSGLKLAERRSHFGPGRRVNRRGRRP